MGQWRKQSLFYLLCYEVNGQNVGWVESGRLMDEELVTGLEDSVELNQAEGFYLIGYMQWCNGPDCMSEL